MDKTCKFNAGYNMVLMEINKEGPEEIEMILSLTLTDLIEKLQETLAEFPEEAHDITIGKLLDMIMADDPEETDSETEDPAE